MQKVKMPESLSGKTILVAGAAGFIPSHLSEFYIDLGARVIGLDNFITGSERNLDKLSTMKNFEFHRCNVYEKLPDFKGLKLDYIFSLASPASPIDFEKIPEEIMRVNAEGTRHLLMLAKEKGARFLEASTSEVYGDPEIHPQTEDYVGHVNPVGPRACYDESKRYAEALTVHLGKKYNIDTRIVRIFNTYGPRMRPDDGRVIPQLINQALKNEELTVNGDGSQTRSFCFVSDLVEAMHRVMFGPVATPVNIGNPDEYSILEAAQIIVKLLNSKSKIGFRPLPKDDPRRRRPDITKLKSFSDFTPKVSFEQGLKQTTDFFRSLL